MLAQSWDLNRWASSGHASPRRGSRHIVLDRRAAHSFRTSATLPGGDYRGPREDVAPPATEYASEEPGAKALCQAQPKEYLSFARHLTAELKTEEFISGKGLVTKWERLRRSNHWFDALYNACAAGHLCGVRLLGAEVESSPAPQKYGELSSHEGRPEWVDMQRWNEMTTRWGM